MKLCLPQIFRCMFAGSAVMSLPVAAETTEYAGAPTELFGKVSDLLTAFDTPASEALLLTVFILLVLAVIVHKPKAP